MQLSEIMNNVHRIMTRYTLVFTSSSERSVSLTEQKKKQRTNFLEKMATYAKTVEIREKTLANILVWLEEWSKFTEAVQSKTIKLTKKIEKRMYK